MPPSPPLLLCPTMLIPRKLTLSIKKDFNYSTVFKLNKQAQKASNFLPILRVTVIMLSDIVESVRLLTDECNELFAL